MTNIDSTENNSLKILAMSAVLITTFLFFIDEGFYNFNWMTDIGSWIAFLIYAPAIFVGQVLVFKFGMGNLQGKTKTLLSIVLGAILGLIFVVGVVFRG